MAIKLYNPDAIARISSAYPDAAKGAVKLIEQAENHGAGSAEIVLRYDKLGDTRLGKYEVMICLRVQERGDDYPPQKGTGDGAVWSMGE